MNTYFFYFSKAFKLIISRLFAVSLESEPNIQKSLRLIFASMNALAPDLFWNMWGHAKTSEKKALNALFNSKDISYDKKELEAIRKVNLGPFCSLFSTNVLFKSLSL